MKKIHKKTMFNHDLTYARQSISEIAKALRTGEWEQISEIANELSAMFSTMTALATDNAEGIENFDCKYEHEIKEIRAQQLEEKWQTAAKTICAELTASTGIKFEVAR